MGSLPSRLRRDAEACPVQFALGRVRPCVRRHPSSRFPTAPTDGRNFQVGRLPRSGGSQLGIERRQRGGEVEGGNYPAGPLGKMVAEPFHALDRAVADFRRRLGTVHCNDDVVVEPFEFDLPRFFDEIGTSSMTHAVISKNRIPVGASDAGRLKSAIICTRRKTLKSSRQSFLTRTSTSSAHLETSAACCSVRRKDLAHCSRR
jgi:hypothetical protein